MDSIKPIINDLIKNVVTPKISSFIKSLNLKYDELLIPKGEHFEEYLYRTYKKYSIINTLVFKNEQRLLKDLYIPLTIYKETLNNKNEEKTKISGYPNELLKKYNRILITDTAGMGKSTLAKRIYLDIIEKGYGIPIYIEMRRLNELHSILNEIKEQIDSFNKEFDLKLLYRFIQTGEFIFILDGYDETSLKDRSCVTNQIQDFISKANKNKFILTSRPEDSLTCFGDFQRFKINSLAKNEAYELLRKYDNQGDVSKLLITELKTGKYEMINEFLKNPLLVSLLFAAFDYKQTIPLKKHVFYRQVYDAYFDSHDLSKGGGYKHEKASGLDIDDFDRVLRHLGFRCLKYQKIEFDKDSLLKIIDDVKNDCSNLNFSASDFFHDILHAVPLFCNDGQYYKWVHKSIQEYFAAQFIYRDAKENQDKILSTMYESNNLNKYINLLDIYYDIDNWGFTKNFTKPICEEYCKFYESSIQECKQLTIDNEDVDNRIGNLFMHDAFIMKRLIIDKKTGNLFSNILDMSNEYLVKRANRVLLNHKDKIIIVSYIHPKRELMKLIYSKCNMLFKRKSVTINDELMIEEEIICKLNLHSFENNITTYKLVNEYLGRNNNLQNIFDYNACKNEIDKINSILNKKSITSTIIDGL